MFMEFPLRSWRNRPSCSSTGSIQICRQLEIEALEERQLLSGAQVFLTPAVLATLQQEAAANTPQWQAFKASLDANLPIVAPSAYNGGQLHFISDYALGYQVLKTIDPVTASEYADKALAYIKSALNDFQRDQSVTNQFLARGDGSTIAFTLPDTAIIPSSVQVYLSPVITQAIIRGAADTQDVIGFSRKVLKVSNAPDGAPDYLEGVDWFRNSNLPQDLIDWSLPGKEPATGATYYVTSTTGYGATPTDFKLNGNTITLPTAPATSQAVYVAYVYGVHAADGSSLAYQQTSAGDGGYNSIFIGNSYTSRYLGRYVAMGLDWLDGYVGFSAALRSQVISMLGRWSDYVRNAPWLTSDNVASNYRAGAYESQVMTALALRYRDPIGPTLVSEILNFRQQVVVSALTNGGLQGGFYPEGWNYGPLAVENILLPGLALEEAGLISAATIERQWASQVIRCLISSQPTPTTVYDGGDWYEFPALFPNNRLFDILSFAADDPVARSYANYVIQSRPGDIKASFIDLLFRNPSAPASFWGPSFPLQYKADGTGLITARADWSYQSTWLAFQLGNLQKAGHQSFSPGQLQVQRGGGDLLVNANGVGGNQDPATKTSFSNLIAINANGDSVQTYPWNMGGWYGTPGVFLTSYEAAANYLYFGGDYRAAYSNPHNPGGGGPATQLTRQVVYLRPDFIIVHDRAGTILSTYPKELRWHFLHAPKVNGNSWEETVGSSHLFGETFSTVPLTTTSYSVVDAGATIYRVATDNANPTLDVQYTTALETSPSSVSSMVGTQQVVSTDGSMEGILMGNYLVLFGKTGPLAPSAGPITYSINSSGSAFNLLTDLQPNESYKVQVNGGPATTLIASGQGTLSFTTSQGASTITVTGISVSNPVPSITSVSQTSAVEGASSFVLTVNGTGLVATSVAEWNGTVLATTFVSNTRLTATVPASDLAEEATANVTVVNPAPGGGTSGAVAFSINDAGLTGTGVVVRATEGFSFSARVSTFTDANPLAPLSDFMTGPGGATINWGDGTATSAGTITQPGGVGTQFVVTGTHKYSDEGSYTITITITDKGGSSKASTATATIADAALSASGVPIKATKGVPFSGQVATFIDANATDPLIDFTAGAGGATINWGDGTPITAGTVTQPGGTGNPFVVTGSHTYLTAGTHTVIITVTDRGGSTATATSTAGNFRPADIVGRDSGGNWWAGISTGASFSTSYWGTWSPAVTWVDVQVGDFTGDGKDDIVGRILQSGDWWLARSNGSGFTNSLWGHWSPSVTWVDVQVGDFNGDGKADIIGRVAGTGQWWVGLSTGSSFTTTLWGNWYSGFSWVDTQVGDFNGNGKSDIASRALENGQWWVGLSTGSSFVDTLWATWYPGLTWVDVKVGDFNGDGKADITGRALESGQWWTNLSTGSSFSTTLWGSWSPSVTWVDVKVGDFNGDGKDDIVGRILQSGDWWVGQSNGIGFTNSLWGHWSPSVTWVDVQVGDFNGNGRDELTGRVLQSGQWWTAQSNGSGFSNALWGTWSPAVTWADVRTGTFT